MDLTIKSPAKLRTMDVKAKNPMPKCTSIDKISRPAQSAFGRKMPLRGVQKLRG